MTLEALRKDMVAAMKAKDKTTKDAVSSLVSAVKKAAIDEGCREDVPEALVARCGTAPCRIQRITPPAAP